MKCIMIPAILIILCSWTGSLHAGNSPDSLGLADLVKLALDRNTDIRIQAGERDIADLNRRRALSALLPRLNADASYIESSASAGIPDFVAANGQKEKLALLALHQIVFDASTFLEYSESGVDQRSQAVNSRQVDQDVVLQVVEAYFSVLSARGQVQILEENLSALDSLYRQSRELFAEGVVRELDVKKSRVEYLLQQNDVARAQNEYRSGLNVLKEAVGIAIETNIEVQEFPVDRTELDSLDAYRSMALANRQDLKLNRLEAERLTAQKRATLLRRLPQVDAGFYYGWDTVLSLESAEPGWQLFVSASLPLWHWGGLSAERRMASVRLTQNEAKYTLLQRRATRDVFDAYNECRLQRQKLQTMKESRIEAAEAVRMAKYGYQEGTVTNLEVINAQRLLTESNVQYLSSLYDFFVAKAQLFHSTGRLGEDLSWIE